MATLNKKLVETLWEASTSAAPEAAVLSLCDLYATVSPSDIARAEHYVRACLVTQGLAA